MHQNFRPIKTKNSSLTIPIHGKLDFSTLLRLNISRVISTIDGNATALRAPRPFLELHYFLASSSLRLVILLISWVPLIDLVVSLGRIATSSE